MGGIGDLGEMGGNERKYELPLIATLLKK